MTVLDEIAAERLRQVEREGWSSDHDDVEHSNGDLAVAAAAYAREAGIRGTTKPWWWPWAVEWWKPGSPRRMLVKAGALIVAEIERLDRASG